jgi:putative endonuclease
MSSDVNRRLIEHNNPLVFNKYTAKHIPWEIKLIFEVSMVRQEALLVERFIKNQKSRIFLEKLISAKDDSDYLNNLINNILKRK